MTKGFHPEFFFKKLVEANFDKIPVIQQPAIIAITTRHLKTGNHWYKERAFSLLKKMIPEMSPSEFDHLIKSAKANLNDSYEAVRIAAVEFLSSAMQSKMAGRLFFKRYRKN